MGKKDYFSIFVEENEFRYRMSLSQNQYNARIGVIILAVIVD